MHLNYAICVCLLNYVMNLKYATVILLLIYSSFLFLLIAYLCVYVVCAGVARCNLQRLVKG
jgi:hypothetical protein